MPLDRPQNPEDYTPTDLRRDATGVFGIGDAENDESPWYTRWYVWLLPILVVAGVLVAILAK